MSIKPEFNMHIPPVFSLIKQSDELTKLLEMDSSWQPCPLTEDQTQKIKDMIDNGEECQRALYAGLRVLAAYLCMSESTKEPVEDINDVSWITKHLAHEIEAITTLMNDLNTRVRLSHEYHTQKQHGGKKSH